MMQDFANGVFGDLNKYIRSEDNALELTAVLKERSENGQSTAVSKKIANYQNVFAFTQNLF